MTVMDKFEIKDFIITNTVGITKELMIKRIKNIRIFRNYITEAFRI